MGLFDAQLRPSPTEIAATNMRRMRMLLSNGSMLKAESVPVLNHTWVEHASASLDTLQPVRTVYRQ